MPFQPSGIGVPVKLLVSPATATLALGGTTLQLSPMLTDIAGTEQTPVSPFTYLSSNPALLTVDANGLCTAVTPADPNALNAGGIVTVIISYPYSNRSNGDTIDVEATITVTGTPAVSLWGYAQRGANAEQLAASDFYESQLGNSTGQMWGWKNYPEELE